MEQYFVDNNGFSPPQMGGWEPIVIRRAEIERKVQELADAPQPEHGIRSTRIVHPRAQTPGQGLAPTIACSIQVLKPGEVAAPMRHNAAEVSLCIRGGGQATIGQQRFQFGKFDVWNTPGMHPFAYRNDGDDLMVRLTYSNAAMLEMMGIHYVEHLDGGPFAANNGAEAAPAAAEKRELSAPIHLENGTQLLTYEHLIAPEVIENKALHWRWPEIQKHADEVFGGGKNKNLGRRGLFVLYNPATGRLMGMTHNVFATLGWMPGDVLDFPHRHSSSAINYCLQGGLISEVNGEKIIWGEGDIAYTAPNWSAHANGGTTGGVALTIQDHPLQIGTESLIWQEGEGKPIRLLGAEPGFVSDDSVVLRGAAA